ncbi:MAG: hypothetical protein KDJ47_00510 [Hyphomicrobiaceae bacterium]|nr:hypothetical protein [Hyphomicrobiaceae bacterium]
MQKRSRDDGRSLLDFIDCIDVACPRCGHHALVRMERRQGTGIVTSPPARLSCHHCGLIRTQRRDKTSMWRYSLRADGRDPYFGIQLWLQEPTRHGLVFAYNEAHLQVLETFVGAELRERNASRAIRWNNRSMASRLPRWMKRAQNRDEMLATLARLRARLKTAQP